MPMSLLGTEQLWLLLPGPSWRSVHCAQAPSLTGLQVAPVSSVAAAEMGSSKEAHGQECQVQMGDVVLLVPTLKRSQ